MGWLDDLQVRAQEIASEGLTDINEYLSSRVNTVVKVGPPPTGNLTPAQVEAGKTGQAPAVAPPAALADAEKAGFSFAMPDLAKYAIPAIIIGAAAYYFSKKRG